MDMLGEPDRVKLFPFPLLLCDIGGTNARFYVAENAENPPIRVAAFLTRDFKSWPDALHAALAVCGIKPASLLVCAAGPANGRQIALTNCSWILDGTDTAQEFHISQGLLLNDFEALAFALGCLSEADVVGIGSDQPLVRGAGMQIVLGPGTGLGLASLLTRENRQIALASEGGHASLAPTSREDREIFEQLELPAGRLTAETILSGSGLVRLHGARDRYFALKGANLSDPALILAAALKNPVGPEALTIRHFWNILAAYAGDMALVLGALQGVTIAGGIMPRLTPFLDPGAFRAIFQLRRPMEQYCRSIPTHLLVNETAPIRAMQALAATPHRFVLDYALRCWV